MNTILWYDLETWGANPRQDSIAQFAALRTTLDLQPLGEEHNLFCQPHPFSLPSPMACKITGLDPWQVQQQGQPEWQFARQLHAIFRQSGTISCGYNVLRFDDEMLRFLFWRNLIEPYGREYEQGNGRFDLMDVMRLAAALRPEGIEWPRKEDGGISFKLEHLAAANGLQHEQAHDALSDVRATLALAQLLHQQHPKLWHWAFALRSKDRVKQLLLSRQPVLYVAGHVPATQGCLTALWPIAPKPGSGNEVICWDLRQSPLPWLDLSADQWRAALYAPKGQLSDLGRPGLVSVFVNRSPMLAPIAMLDESLQARWQLPVTQLQQHLQQWQGHPELLTRVQDLYAQPQEWAKGAWWPRDALYQGFLNGHDRERLLSLPEQAEQIDWLQLRSSLQDERLAALVAEQQLLQAPESLSMEARQYWLKRWHARMQEQGWPVQWQELQQLKQQHPERLQLWQGLEQWYRALASRLGAPDSAS